MKRMNEIHVKGTTYICSFHNLFKTLRGTIQVFTREEVSLLRKNESLRSTHLCFLVVEAEIKQIELHRPCPTDLLFFKIKNNPLNCVCV